MILDENFALKKIENAPPTLRDMAQERMRMAIIEGHFEPGDRLVERPICEQLGVSRTVIRETIRYLEAEGLVEILPNRGPIVARMDSDQAQQIYDIRRQLEGSAASTCAERYGRIFPEQLGQRLKALELSSTSDSWATLFQATNQFYEIIFREAGHLVAWEIVHRLNGRISRLRALTLAAKDRKRPGLFHMTAIHDAVISRDPDAAKAAVVAHIDDASAIASRMLGDE